MLPILTQQSAKTTRKGREIDTPEKGRNKSKRRTLCEAGLGVKIFTTLRYHCIETSSAAVLVGGVKRPPL